MSACACRCVCSCCARVCVAIGVYLWTFFFFYFFFVVEKAFVVRTYEAQVLLSWVLRKKGINAKCVMDIDATGLKWLLSRKKKTICKDV